MSKVDDLREERRLLLKRVEVIDDVLQEYNEWERRVALLLPSSKESAPLDALAVATANALPDVGGEHDDVSPTDGPPATPMPQFLSAVGEILQEIDRPLVRTPFLQALAARGIVVGGRDERNTLSARLNRMTEVVNLPGHGFWAKGRPYAQAGYNPNNQADKVGFAPAGLQSDEDFEAQTVAGDGAMEPRKRRNLLDDDD